MGIPGLLPMLKEHLVYKPVEELGGCVVGVDGFSWLYKAASVYGVDLYLNPGDKEVVRKYTQFCVRKCQALLEKGARLYFVFDGDDHPMKAETSRKRREKKAAIRSRIDDLQRKGKKREARALMSRCIKVDRAMVDNLITELDALGIQHITAPYEADPQLVCLEKDGLIDFIATEDSDLIVYGGNRILFKLNEAHGGELFDREQILQKCPEAIACLLGRMKEIVALSGCDYTEGIKKVGLLTAHKLMMEYKTLEGCILHLSKKSSIDLDYLDLCIRVVCTFYFHIVKDPHTKKRRHLSSVSGSQDACLDSFALEDISFVGSLSDPVPSSHSALSPQAVSISTLVG
ncbi:exonuclease 1 [Nematocida displodere]|uniref:Exonuclease 1 n=1 Tax=Nematocida displodere TaxID=1805483 RepID=A0A177EIP9_9MICR|nr:exonuclease 1 [Nematocida displodere]